MQGNKMDIKGKVLRGLLDVLKSDTTSIYYILYYTLLEGILVLAIPLTSSFVINSLIAHTNISLIALGIIICVVFVFIIILRLFQEYIIEKFEQRVFVSEGYQIATKAFALQQEKRTTHYPIDKLMNYFFDITTIQKILPILILNGSGLLIQIAMTFLLLLIFSVDLFIGAFSIIVLYGFALVFLGQNGILFAVKRSDTKHNAIHFLQKVPIKEYTEDEMLIQLEENMSEYVDARQAHYGVRIKQLAVSFLTQGLIITGFFLLGGYLVINGKMPVGEFVAAEIVIVTLMYTLNNFVKQLDYIYDGIEGFYKIGKLSSELDTKESEAK